MSYILEAMGRLEERAWMYHGSPRRDITALTPDRDEFMLDRAIGTHFAADKTISQRFATQGHSLKGMGGGDKPAEPGIVYKTKAPPRSQLQVIHQQAYRNKKTGQIFGRESDQHAIGRHVSGTVFSQPENKEMFKAWVKRRSMVDDDTAEKVHAHLSQGKAPSKKEFGMAGSDDTSFHSYVGNFDSGLHMKPYPGFKQEVVHKYLDIMKKRGIKGLVYQNTSPMETGDRDRFGNKLTKPRSTKSYVIFHPEELPLEHD